jgi:hypothetical protein
MSKELLPKPFAVAGHTFLPLFVLHRGAPFSSWQLAACSQQLEVMNAPNLQKNLNT